MKPAKQWNALLAIVLVLLFGVSVTGLAFALSSSAIAPITTRVISVSEMGNTRDVRVEFVRKEAAARFAEAHRLQIRVAGRWQPWANIPKFNDGNLLDGTNAQQMSFEFPSGTEACRFSIGYRLGPRPYCQAYFFLSRHGVSQRFPAISRAILKRFPQQPRLRHVECELNIG